MPSNELSALLKGDVNMFFVIKVEDMYRHLTRPVPASRSTTHTCLFLTEGEATMIIGSQKYTIMHNEMLFVPAGQVFSFNETDINKGYLCNFDNDILVGKFSKPDLLKVFDFLQVWGNPKITLDDQTASFVIHIFKRILLDYSQNALSNLNIIQPYLIAMLCEVNRVYQPLFSNKHEISIKITNRFQELIFTNLRSKHLVTEYASLLHVTPNHLNKVLKVVTGKSAGKWIDEAIILESKVLLSQTSYSINKVSLEIGLLDPSYFTRLFKKIEGITPSAYRKRIEKS